MGLLDELLGGQGAAGNAGNGSNGGGLGSALGGGGLMAVAAALLSKAGGVGGLVSMLQQHGLGGAAQSWVGTGENQPVAPDQLSQALQGGGLGNLVQEAAAKMGTSPDELMAKLSGVLPQAVDHLTPQGQVPEQPSGGFDTSALSGLAGKVFG
ncbi:YidB family protein [Pinirhizobacter sp.]|jgi:uncharacterized protein YidB (DUF937 family)|uniref:YidB family protein n=1 Tax=Pinirhizobacter sp. TaxID=2950432 RepID=UPI002F408C53